MSTDKPRPLNKKQKALIEREKQSFIEEYANKMNYRMPSQILMDLANDGDTANRERAQAAIALLPYTDSKKATQVDHNVENTTNINVEVKHTNALDQLNQMLEVKPSDDIPKIVEEAEFIEVDEE